MMTQAWVDRVMKCGLDSPDVVGPPRTEEDDKKDAWTLRWCARFVELGIPLHVALDAYKAGEPHDLSEDAEQAADDEISYWCEDDGDSHD
jgi:hypothetical protein